MRLLPAEELLIGEDWWKSCHLGYGPWFIAHVHAPAPVNGPTPVHTEAVLTGLRGEEREEEEIKLWGGMLWNLEGVAVGECGLDMIKLLCTVHEILKEQTQSILKNGASTTAS